VVINKVTRLDVRRSKLILAKKIQFQNKIWGDGNSLAWLCFRYSFTCLPMQANKEYRL